MNQYEFDEDELEEEEDKMKLAISRRQKENDRLVMKRLRSITKKSYAELIPEDKAFLRARMSYLTAGQRAEYEEILNDDPDLNQEQKPKELSRMTRPELEALALSLDIEDPEAYANSSLLREAIKQAQAAQVQGSNE